MKRIVRASGPARQPSQRSVTVWPTASAPSCRLGHEEAHLDVAGRQQRHDRRAGRHPFARAKSVSIDQCRRRRDRRHVSPRRHSACASAARAAATAASAARISSSRAARRADLELRGELGDARAVALVRARASSTRSREACPIARSASLAAQARSRTGAAPPRPGRAAPRSRRSPAAAALAQVVEVGARLRPRGAAASRSAGSSLASSANSGAPAATCSPRATSSVASRPRPARDADVLALDVALPQIGPLAGRGPWPQRRPRPSRRGRRAARSLLGSSQAAQQQIEMRAPRARDRARRCRAAQRVLPERRQQHRRDHAEGRARRRSGGTRRARCRAEDRPISARPRRTTSSR